MCIQSHYGNPNQVENLRLLNVERFRCRSVFNDIVFCFKALRGESELRAGKYRAFMPTHGRPHTTSLQCANVNRDVTAGPYISYVVYRIKPRLHKRKDSFAQFVSMSVNRLS